MLNQRRAAVFLVRSHKEITLKTDIIPFCLFFLFTIRRSDRASEQNIDFDDLLFQLVRQLIYVYMLILHSLTLLVISKTKGQNSSFQIAVPRYHLRINGPVG